MDFRRIFNITIALSLMFSSEKNFSLEEMMTKAPVENIRYITDDGKITYFSKKSGGLYIASNYTVNELLKEDRNSGVWIRPGNKDLLMIFKNKTFHTFYTLRQKYNIYLNKVNGTKLEEVGQGQNGGLLLDDRWYFIYENLVLKLYSTKTKKINFSIKLKTDDIYFTSSLYMTDLNNFYYLDQDIKKREILFHYDRVSRKRTKILESKPQHKIDICQIEKDLYIGEFPLFDTISLNKNMDMSRISKLINGKLEVIYKSDLHDIGQMQCEKKEKKIYFVKSFDRNKSFDIAAMNLKNGKVNRLTNFSNAKDLLRLGGRVLLYYRDKYYIVYGKQHYKNDIIK